MNDPTETVRRQMIESGQPARDLAEADQTWTTTELGKEFEVLSFMAPFVTARRRSDGQLGSLEFTHSPRVYFGWREHS